MKTVRLLAISAILTALFATAAFAQSQPTKIAVINTQAFAATTGGITKYVNAQKRLNDEFKVTNQQLNSLATRINALKKEIQTFQNNRAKNIPVDAKTVNAKVEQHDNLVRELKFKQEDAKAKIEKRSNEVLGPISDDIFKAMQTYANQKGYTMILDGGQLTRAGLILAFDRKYDVTKDFIAYYNTRPGGTARTTK